MATNSGLRRLVHGTRERILSSDHNREQSFEAAMIADALRYLYEAEGAEEQAGGVATLAGALGNPMKAVIFNGLRVRPEIGTLNLFIDAGMGLFIDPGSPASPDDSPAQAVRSSGQTVAGALVISAPGGGVRIDVIECATSQVVVETDSRDVFSTSTGTFTPQLMNKVVEAQLTFRVRAGTPGAGFPGTASGWTPLCVAKVPSAAVSNDDCDFWDVRPLRSDFTEAHLIRSSFPAYRRQNASAIEEGSGNWRARGIVEAELNGRRIGGNLVPAVSGLTYLDLTSGGVNQEPGFSATASRPWYLWLAFPFGLPRWSKLSPASSGTRAPMAPRGIPIFTQKAPAGMSAAPASSLSLPTATGLGGTTSFAVVALSGAFGAGPTFCGSVVGSDGWTRVLSPGISVAPSSGNNTAAPHYQLGTTVVPANASAVRLRVTTTIADSAGSYSLTRLLDLYDAVSGNAVLEERWNGSLSVPAGGSIQDQFEVELELPPNLPTGAAITRELVVTYGWSGTATYSAQSVIVVGWRLG